MAKTNKTSTAHKIAKMKQQRDKMKMTGAKIKSELQGRRSRLISDIDKVEKPERWKRDQKTKKKLADSKRRVDKAFAGHFGRYDIAAPDTQTKTHAKRMKANRNRKKK